MENNDRKNDPINERRKNDRRNVERRKSTRIIKSFMIRFRGTEPHAPSNAPLTWNLVTVENLSADGVLFKFNKVVELNALVDIKLDFPGIEQPIQCVGRVHRIEKVENTQLSLITVIFTSISQHDKELIQKTAELM